MDNSHLEDDVNHRSNLFYPQKLILLICQLIVELNKNYHKAFLDKKYIKPLLINNLRLPNRS